MYGALFEANMRALDEVQAKQTSICESAERHRRRNQRKLSDGEELRFFPQKEYEVVSYYSSDHLAKIQFNDMAVTKFRPRGIIMLVNHLGRRA